MGTAPALLLFCLFSIWTRMTRAQPQYFVVPWSKDRYGPDGPWQAVVISVGGNSTITYIEHQNTSELAVYPGGTWQSMTFTPDACKSYPNTLCGSGGTWVPDEYQARQRQVSDTGNWTDVSTGIQVENVPRRILGTTIDRRTVLNTSLLSASSGNVTYPNGQVGGVTLGNLALGADDTFQRFTLTDNDISRYVKAYLYAGWLYENQTTTSYSYGLHIGSAAFKYPGSLVFGGYDKGRVIEPVTVFASDKEVQLMDISIGVATGGSPFNFSSRKQLLSTGPINIWPDPLAPYLSLPKETCDNLASVLPITFDEKLKYYLWNTEDANYTRIVSSPAYLGFTFPPAPATTDNVVIKVPFALLNLTLEPPITDTPKQYFPCVPTKFEYKLGRAFLQAAFIGRNWNTKTSWLAQAPGPGPARQGLGLNQYINMPNDAKSIEGYAQEN